MKTILTRDGALNFRGRDPDNMNQYFLNKRYEFSQVQSVQIEIRKKGFRTKKYVNNTAEIIAGALSELVNLPLIDLEVIETPAENLPVAVIDPDEELVNKAYEYLKETFRKHFHNALVEAANYIIKTFSDDNPRLAFAKNKAKDQKPPLIKLIKKLAGASQNPMETVPSVTWFYNAVNLAAHEAICQKERLQTFAILGHSHKLELLHVPKLKTVQGKDFGEVIGPAFKEKERLAVVALDKKFSVRDFKTHIKTDRLEKERAAKVTEKEKQLAKEFSEKDIDWMNFPSISELRKFGEDKLIGLQASVQGKIDESKDRLKSNRKPISNLEGEIDGNQKMRSRCHYAWHKLKTALSEIGKYPEEGKGGYRDWTGPGDNINICEGCENDCRYCYAKPGINFYCKVPKGEWHLMKIKEGKVAEKQKLHQGMIGFHSTHDILPSNIDACLTVLGKLLRAHNEVLIVSKPRLSCITRICEAAQFYKDKIIFRFTIGAMDDEILSFWEPNAPKYDERKACLMYAKEKGFETSVSMEPMLDIQNIDALIEDLRLFVSETIWLGTMNHEKFIKHTVDEVDEALLREIAKIEAGQTPEKLMAIYNKYKDDEKILWKSDPLKIISAYFNKKGD